MRDKQTAEVSYINVNISYIVYIIYLSPNYVNQYKCLQIH